MFNGLKKVKTLIEEGTDVNVKANNGNTPLHLASENGRTETVKLLENAMKVNHCHFETVKLQEKIDCAICMEPMIEEGSKLKVCTHIYHKECISSWIKIGNCCPYCKRQI